MINMRDICTHTSPSLLMLMLGNVYNDGWKRRRKGYSPSAGWGSGAVWVGDGSGADEGANALKGMEQQSHQPRYPAP